MQALRASQAAFLAALHQRDPGASQNATSHLAPSGKRSAAAGLEVYQNMYLARLVGALAEDFPNLQKLLGEERFAAVCEAYLRVHPSTHPSINAAGQHLPAYLALAETKRPDAAELAALEWARAEAYVAAGCDVAGPEALVQRATADGTGEALAASHVRFVPALTTLACEHDVASLWRALEGDLPIPSPEPLSCTLVVWRPNLDVLHTCLQGPAAEALRRAQEGRPLGEAFEAFASLPEPGDAAFKAIAAWFTDGWVAAF